MTFVLGNLNKLIRKNCTVRSISSFLLSRKSFETDGNNTKFHNNTSVQINLSQTYNRQFLSIKYKLCSPLVQERNFSKKKGSKRNVEEEESDSDKEEYEYDENINIDDLDDSVVTRTLASLRIDSVIKAGLGVTKKKIEQDFYAFKLRVNGEKVVKKALIVRVGDEIDRVKGFSPDTSKFLLVDRIIIKGIDNPTGIGSFPVKLEIFKSLTIKNYEDPWNPDYVE